MGYGKIKVDTLTWDNSGTPTDISIGTLPTANNPVFTGDITINAQGDIHLADADSSHYVGFQAPATVASNIVWTLPATDASSSGDSLVSDGAGNLSFTTIGASGSNTEIQFNNSGSFGSSSSLTFNDSTDVLTSTNVHDSGGDVRKLVNGGHKTSTYELVASDSGALITTNGGNIELKKNVFSLGDMITIVNYASTSITISPSSSLGVTEMYLAGDSTAKSSLTLAGRGIATIVFPESSGIYCYVTGAGLT